MRKTSSHVGGLIERQQTSAFGKLGDLMNERLEKEKDKLEGTKLD